MLFTVNAKCLLRQLVRLLIQSSSEVSFLGQHTTLRLLLAQIVGLILCLWNAFTTSMQSLKVLHEPFAPFIVHDSPETRLYGKLKKPSKNRKNYLNFARQFQKLNTIKRKNYTATSSSC